MGKLAVRWLRARESPDSAQVDPAMHTAHGHHNHVAIGTCILLTKEHFDKELSIFLGAA